MQSNLPDSIGRYEVLSRLGRGGMGVVYRGRDPRIGGRFVAIKLLHVSEDGLVDRFLQEAATAGVLDHPNIVKVYDFGEHLGDPFIVMEFVEGVTLAELIRTRSPLSLARKLEVIRDVAIGLDYAHNMGVVHRDVKPANLMIRNGGSVKILDFGIARVANTGMTQVGDQLGTPNYMSPEQIEGTPVDRRSDVFGLGLVFYELLALRRAFSGQGTMQVMAQILHQSPEPIDRVCLNLDPAIARIVHTAIEKDPERRYQSLAALASDVDDIRRRMRDAGDESGGPLSDLPQREPGSETITAILRQARRDLESGNFASAVRAASEILARDPSNDTARSLSREALAALDELRAREEHEKHARRTIEAQEEAFRKGQIKEALAALDHFTPRHSLVTAAAARLRAEAEEIELQRRAEEQRHLAQARWAAREVETAREGVRGHRFDEAIATLEHVKQVCPDLAEVDDVLAQARAGLAAAAADSRRRRDVADLVASANRAEQANRFEDARRSFQSALQLDAGHTEARAGLARIEASMKRAVEEQRRRVERERHLEATVRGALAQSDAGAHSAALLVLDALDGADARVAAARSVIAPRLRAAEAVTRARAAEAQRLEEERERLELEDRRRREVAASESARSAFEGDETVIKHERERDAQQLDATVVRGSSTRPFEQTGPRWKGKLEYVAGAVVVLVAGVGYVWYSSTRPALPPPAQGNSLLGSGPTVAGPATTRNAGGEGSSDNKPKEDGLPVAPNPSSGAPKAVDPAAEPERLRIARIESLLAREDLASAADQIAGAMKEFKQSPALNTMARNVRSLANSRALAAKDRAVRSGRTTVDAFKRGNDRLADIAGWGFDDRPESLKRVVGAYLEAARSFDDAANAPAPPPTTALPPGSTITLTPTVISPPVAPVTGTVSPQPSSSSTPVVRRAAISNDEAETVLQTFADLWERFDPKQLAEVYPPITDSDFEKKQLAAAKQRYNSCQLTFSKLHIKSNNEGEDVAISADSKLVCKPKSGHLDPQYQINDFTLRKVVNGWQVIRWTTGDIRR